MFDVRALDELAAALEGIAILGVLPRSPAALAGVRFGDVLLEMNGVRVRSWADYIRATTASGDGASERFDRGAARRRMEAVVFRGGQSIRLSFHTEASSTPPDYLAIVLDMAANRLAGARLDDDPSPS
ncbi:MAG: PDZ domain-containing protein [Polyangiaceae bacterium]